MKKIYSVAKQATVAVAIMFGSFFSTQAFGQVCGPIVENFNNTGGGTAGFGGSLQFASTGNNNNFNGFLQKTNVASLDVLTVTTPTYQLANNVTTFGLGFTLAGSATIGDMNVQISYVSTVSGAVVTKSFGTPPINYTGSGSNHQAVICTAVGTSTYSDFPTGGRYRFIITMTVVQGNNGTSDVTFDDFRTTGTLSQITLPVTFISFDANKVSAGVQLNWRVADVDNVNHYEVERSSDGRNFASIATVALSKNNSYSYLDVNAGGTVYYRIKNVDNDGQFKFSSISRIANGLSSIVMNAFPQPAASRLTVQHATITNNALFTLSTVDGRVVSTIRPTTGSMQTMVDLSKLQSGLYLLRFNDGQGNTETLKVVKQ